MLTLMMNETGLDEERNPRASVTELICIFFFYIITYVINKFLKCFWCIQP